jgi:hypothetical protein
VVSVDVTNRSVDALEELEDRICGYRADVSVAGMSTSSSS